MTELPQLFPKDQRLCVLAGSGISVASPSCLPTGLSFMKLVFSQLLPEELKNDFDKFLDPETPKFLRFEQLMAYVQLYDPDLHILDTIGLCSQPNANHLALAHMIRSGHVVFTTNFDSLIEHGLLCLETSQSTVYPVINRAEWESQCVGMNAVFKLHGSVRNVSTGEDCRQSIQATIRQIARGKDRAIALEPWKLRNLELAVTAHDLLVVGYSGFDDFDIVPALEKTPTTKSLIWVDHDEQRSLSRMIVQTPGELTSSGHLDRFLRSVAQGGRRKASVRKVRVHTGELLQWLVKRSGFITIGKADSQSNASPKLHPLLTFRLSEAKKWYAAGEICSHHDPHESIQLFERAKVLAVADEDRWMVRQCNNYLGRQYEALFYRSSLQAERMDWWHRAITYYGKAGSAAECGTTTDDVVEQARALRNAGALYLGLDTANAARKARVIFTQALELERPLADSESRAWSHNQLGVASEILGEGPTAVSHFKQACALDRDIGDLDHLVVHLGNLGKCLCDQGDRQGVAVLQESVEVAKALGIFERAAVSLKHLGDYWTSCGHQSKAQEYYQQSLDCLGTLTGPKGFREMLQRSLSMDSGYLENGLSAATNRYLDMAGQLSAAGDYESAEGYFTRLLRQHPTHSAVLNNMGSNYTRWGRLEDAERMFHNCIQLHRDHALSRKNLGDVLLRTHRYREAKAQYEDALRIQSGYARAWFGLGIVHHELQEWHQAEDCFRQATFFDPSDHQSFMNLGGALYAQNRWQEALDAYEEAKILNPNESIIDVAIKRIRPMIT